MEQKELKLILAEALKLGADFAEIFTDSRALQYVGGRAVYLRGYAFGDAFRLACSRSVLIRDGNFDGYVYRRKGVGRVGKSQ